MSLQAEPPAKKRRTGSAPLQTLPRPFFSADTAFNELSQGNGKNFCSR